MIKIPSPLPSSEQISKIDPNRDRIIDFLRAFSLLIVVFGHIFMAMVIWSDEVPEVGNIIASSKNLQLLTWILQVMPLFFFAGGASNAISWGRKSTQGYAPWLWGRASRLLRPLWVYLIFMAPIAAISSILLPVKSAAPLLLLTTQLLWFLGAYLVVISLAPLMFNLHKKAPILTLTLLALLTAIIDFLRLGLNFPLYIGIINFVTVWLFASQLGVWYIDGKLNNKIATLFATLGILTNIILVTAGPYPLSMVGMPGEKISNMAPPTIALLAHTLWLCSLAKLISPLISYLAHKLTIWRYVTAINLSAMTIYLWHLPILISLSALEKFISKTAPLLKTDNMVLPGENYWLWWSLHTLIFFTLLTILVRYLWVLENKKLIIWDKALHLKKPNKFFTIFTAGLGVLLTGISLLMLSATGLAGFPTRVITYAGLPLTSGAATLTLLLGASLVRYSGGERINNNKK